jgi:protein TonB
MTSLALDRAAVAAPDRAPRSLLPLVFEPRPPTTLLCWLAVVGVGLGAHAGLIVVSSRLLARKAAELPPMEVVLAPLAAPPPPAPPPPLEPEPEPAPPARAVREQPSLPRPEVRARAGRVLAAVSGAAEAESKEGIVTGDAEQYAGGQTASSGTSAEPVEPAPPSPPPAPPPPPPRRRVDTVALTRAYLAKIGEAIAREKRYPLAAERSGIQGTVIVGFAIDAAGAFARISIASSSGSDLLDRAAVATVAALSRKIARPTEIGELELPLRVPIRFEISE